MAFSCCGLVCEIGISLTTYYRRRRLDCGSQTLRRSRTGHVFGEQVVEALHLGVRDQTMAPRARAPSFAKDPAAPAPASTSGASTAPGGDGVPGAAATRSGNSTGARHRPRR